MATIFISYCREDIDLAKKVAHELENQGQKVFIDLNILPGTTFPEVIASEIQKAEVFALIVTSNILTSQYVNNELGLAHGLYVNDMSLIIPIVWKNAQLPAIIDKINWIDIDDNNIVQKVGLILQSISDFKKKKIAKTEKKIKDRNAVLKFLDKSRTGMARQQTFALIFIATCFLMVTCEWLWPTLQKKIPLPFYIIAIVMLLVVSVLGVFVMETNKCITHCDIASLKCEIEGPAEGLSEATNIACLRSTRNSLLSIVNN